MALDMHKSSFNSFGLKESLRVEGNEFYFFSLKEAATRWKFDLKKMPNSIKILLENLLRSEDGIAVKRQDIESAVTAMTAGQYRKKEISFYPARVLMQDFTGVPAIVDLASMRDAIVKLGGAPEMINPLIPVDLVIDHSVQVDKYGTADAFATNVAHEMRRNLQRYEFLRWGQHAFKNFRVVPPGTGICHQVNLEYLAQVVQIKEVNGEKTVYPDTLVGTDSHTTMVNGLSVLGWGVGGIEAEAAMLGQPISMLIPPVVGLKLKGKLKEGVNATDLVLTVTQMLRAHGVVGKFVEFYGSGLDHLTLADRATIANMAPEYGATCGFFPIDQETLIYLESTGRKPEQIKLVEAYAKAQGLWRDVDIDPVFSEALEIDMSTVEASVAGPKRPQDRVSLPNIATEFDIALSTLNKDRTNENKSFPVAGAHYELKNGDVVISAITSCTNTSNPYVMIGAALVAKKAIEKGVRAKPWVKTSLAPGSQIVTSYLQKSGLDQSLDKLGFNLVGYGCTTCIGNSGPLLPEIESTISANNLVVSSVLSGNRNFEGRVHPLVRANYLASPMLCVAYAIAGTVHIDLTKDPIAQNAQGENIYLKDIWPSSKEIHDVMSSCLGADLFVEKYRNVFDGPDDWKKIKVGSGSTYTWDLNNTYIKHPSFFEDNKQSYSFKIEKAQILGIFGDSITTDHISPAGNIAKDSPAAQYLLANGVQPQDFNSYGARRGNHEVMMRGTFANPRIKNKILPGKEGGYTKHYSSNEIMTIYDAAMQYTRSGMPLVIFAGKEYGSGSSRDWAAKGTKLLGIKAVIAESFERIHRSNLVGMGVLPLMLDKISVDDLKLEGDELISIHGIEELAPKKIVKCIITKANVVKKEINLICLVDTDVEVEYLKSGGILQYVLRSLYNAKK